MASMRVTVIGCSGSFPGPDSPSSCYLLEAEGFRLVIDLGNGALGVLQRYAPLFGVDAICVSHLHADHCVDLASYWVARLEPARVQVTWLKQGRTAATARATLIQDDRPVLETTVTTGSLGQPGDGGLSWTGKPPPLPPIEQCAGFVMRAQSAAFAGYAGQVDLRLDPATTGWLHGEPAGVPEMRGYFRLREDRDPDAYLLALAVDALPPVVLGLGPFGWSPTVELTWHMRAAPAAGPLRIATRGRHVSGGWFDEEAEVWDAADRLVAQSRQIARVGRRRVT